MRVYHFLNRKFGLEDIRERRLKIASIDALNDPFELLGFSSHDPEVRKAFQKTKAELARRSGILCFSRSWRNPVQWSHYADYHAGLCLGFDVPETLLMSVSYVRHRPVPDLAVLSEKGSAANLEMQRVLATKFRHWRYEEEVRAFISLDEMDQDKGLYFKTFDDDLILREVIVGAASSLTRSEIRDALGKDDGETQIRKARLAFRSFRVVEQRRADLWT